MLGVTVVTGVCVCGASYYGALQNKFALRYPSAELASLDEGIRSMAEAIGKRIRARRLRLDLTQDEVCDATGLSKGFYSDIENDKTNMSVANVVRVADALSVSVEWLIRGHHPKKIKCPVCDGKGTITL